MSNSKTSTSTSYKRRISSKAVFALIFYLIMPAIAISIILTTYPELSKDRFIGILMRIIPISMVLILISQFQVRYEKGSRGRFVLNELYVILVLLWVFALLGGEPIIHQTWEEYQFSLNIWNYLLLIFFVTSMNILYYAVEYQAWRNKETESGTKNTEKEIEDGKAKHKGVTISTIQTQ